MEKEIWKDVSVWINRKKMTFNKKYQASTFGRIKSFKITTTGIILKQIDINGYKGINLCNDGKPYLLYVHKIVLETFVEKKPEGMECCHKDGTRFNNFLTNIRWGTPIDNKNDYIVTMGRPAGGLFSNKEVLDIKTRLCDGESYYEIAKDYNVNHRNIYNIKINRSGTHVAWPNIPKKFYKKPSAMKLGIKGYNSKLSEYNIRSIKKLIQEKKYNQASIARMYGVNVAIISKIKHGLIWKNV